MKKLYLFLIILLLSLVLYSCGEPPEGTEEVKLISFIKENLDILNNIKDDEDKMKKYFKDMSSNLQTVLAFYKGTVIEIQSSEAAPKEKDIVHSMPDNQFLINKPLYITFDKKKTFFSFDNITWYSNESNADETIEGVKNEFDFQTDVQDDKLTVNYKMAISMGRNPIILDEKETKKLMERQVVALKKGMVFSNQDEKKINTDLNKTILFVPKDTLLSGYVNVEGNILQSQSRDLGIRLEAMQNLYFYVKGRKISFSFDKENWKLNILSFSIDPEFEVYAKSDKHIFLTINAKAVYNDNEVSFSLVKLLISMM